MFKNSMIMRIELQLSNHPHFFTESVIFYSTISNYDSEVSTEQVSRQW